ncbi:hypothetical protein C7P77_03370 [Staphylococcus aureus]|nr:hypothetical protein C7P77_03370 [Staphylococcus aureus]
MVKSPSISYKTIIIINSINTLTTTTNKYSNFKIHIMSKDNLNVVHVNKIIPRFLKIVHV